MIIVAAAHAPGLFFLIMSLLTVPGSWAHGSNVAWQIRIIYAVTLG